VSRNCRRKGILLGHDPARASEADAGRAVAASDPHLAANWREEAALAAAAQAKAKAANDASRAVREAKLIRETCATWVDILVREAIAESDRRGGVAAKMQASIRGRAARVGFARMKKAITTIQATRRGMLGKRVLVSLQGRRHHTEQWEAVRPCTTSQFHCAYSPVFTACGAVLLTVADASARSAYEPPEGRASP
jgi:hypothetical protein